MWSDRFVLRCKHITMYTRTYRCLKSKVTQFKTALIFKKNGLKVEVENAKVRCVFI